MKSLRRKIKYIVEKTDHYLDELQKLVESQEICIYCWRGPYRP